MIARYRQRFGDALEETGPIMMYGARLAVQRNRSVHGGAAKRLGHALHAQADAQYGELALAATDELRRDSGGARALRARAHEHVVGPLAADVLYRESVGAKHRDVQVVTPEHLDE